MADNLTTPKDSWFSEHKSANFIFGLFLAGLIFVTSGILLHDEKIPIKDFFAKLLIELSIASFAGGIATTFLSLRDIRHNLASTMATLISEGQVVNILSINTQKRIFKEIMENNIRSKALFAENSLFNNLTNLSNQCLQMVHLYHYHWQQTLGQHPNNPRLLVNDVVRTFRAKASHLRPPVKFNFKLLHEISIQSFPDMKSEDFLLSFTAMFGDKHFSIKDIIVKKDQIGAIEVFRCIFENDIEMLEEEIDATIAYKIAYMKEENTSAAIVRYPTLGSRLLCFAISGVNVILLGPNPSSG